MNLYALLDLSLPGYVMEPKDLLVRGQWRHALTFRPDSSMIWPIRVEGGACESKDSLVAFISLNEFISPRTLNKYNWICIPVWVLRAGYKRGCRHGRILQLALSCAYDACAPKEEDLRVQWQCSAVMSASGKSLLGLWLYRSGEQEWSVKQGSPLHQLKKDAAAGSSAPVSHSNLSRHSSAPLEPPRLSIGPSAGQDPPRQHSPGERISIIFTLRNQVGNLARALQVFQELGINVLHLELSPLESATNQADVLVDVECDPRRLDQVVKMLNREVASVNYTSVNTQGLARAPSLSACSSFGEFSSRRTIDSLSWKAGGCKYFPPIIYP